MIAFPLVGAVVLGARLARRVGRDRRGAPRWCSRRSPGLFDRSSPESHRARRRWRAPAASGDEQAATVAYAGRGAALAGVLGLRARERRSMGSSPRASACSTSRSWPSAGFAPDVYHTALAVTAITGLAGNFAAGALADRGSLRTVLVAALLILTGALAALAHVTTVAHVMAQAVAMGIAGGFVMVVFFSFWGRAYGRAHLGRIQGAAQAMTVLASAIGPLFLASCVETHRARTRAAFYALAAVVAALASRRRSSSPFLPVRRPRRVRASVAAMRPGQLVARGPALLLADATSPSSPAWPRRSPCSPARCSSAIPSAAACATWCCSVSATPTSSSCRRTSSARRWRGGRRHPDFATVPAVAPLVMVAGLRHRIRRAAGAPARCRVYGVDDRFWRFHGVGDGPAIDGSRGAASARRWRARSAPRPGSRCSSACSGRPTSRSNRCTGGKTTSAARCG